MYLSIRNVELEVNLEVRVESSFAAPIESLFMLKAVVWKFSIIAIYYALIFIVICIFNEFWSHKIEIDGISKASLKAFLSLINIYGPTSFSVQSWTEKNLDVSVGRFGKNEQSTCLYLDHFSCFITFYCPGPKTFHWKKSILDLVNRKNQQ